MTQKMTRCADHQQRLEALHPTRSFIVQAPAGSGKTGLLVKRYLALLARVAEPEEILAITFTRKATAEMRHRILSALANVKEADAPKNEKPKDDDHELEKKLAKLALANDQRLGWNILDNPRRLRIQTIDAFCYELVGRMPWSARFGAAPNVLEDQNTELAYLQAAKRTLDHIEEHDDWSTHCANLIKLLDARFDKAQSLLAMMLKKRDRWMRGLKTTTRAQYEMMWRQVIEQQLAAATRSIPDDLKTEIAALAKFAAANPYARNPNADLICCLEMDGFPDPVTESLKYWRGIASLVLTNQLEVRKTVDARLGFPPNHKPEKLRMKSVLETMARDTLNGGGAVQALTRIPLLPDDTFTDEQWAALQSLLALLPVAAAELRLLYKENNQADYIEITQRAEMALGDADSPSDLALFFDYQLKHLLMDEVQDTSRAQLELLTKLTSGWQHGDGRTLFFVGDPMQSIYRFREAEVATFLSIQEKGIGEIKPKTLILETNFRSTTALVDWYNHIFSRIFPAQDDIINSAVRYSRSIALHEDESTENNYGQGAVSIHPQVTGSRESEAANICAQVKLELEQKPDAQIGILGRNRRHLVAITQSLREHDISFQAIELESLIQRPAIQDLMALTRGLIQLSDRIAWLSILRAPWCGMTLEDMSVLCMNDHNSTIVELCTDDKIVADMSRDGFKRLARLLEALAAPLAQRGRVSLRQNVEAAWLSLAAPTCIDQSDIADCESYFELLGKLENDHDIITVGVLSDAVARLWSRADDKSQVQVLTIHKSKGLEFDVVMLPQLHRIARTPERELMRWTRLPDQLLIAVLPHSDAKDDKFYKYLGDLEQLRQQNELRRLLYVACTRARQKLHLYMTLHMSGDPDTAGQPKAPPKSALLNLLWPSLQKEIAQSLVDADSQDSSAARQERVLPLTEFKRLPLKWQRPDTPPGIMIDQSLNQEQIDSKSEESEQIEFSWAGETVRIIGIAIHKMLQQIDQDNWPQWKSEDTETLLSKNRIVLMDNGLYGEQLEIGATNMRDAIENLKADLKADWIFSSAHHQVKREWPLTGFIDNAFSSIVIDRSFVDQHGIRWIVDFKSSRHKGGDVQAFMAREKTRYQQQLEHYANIVRMLEQHETKRNEIKLGLYFPLLKGWCEWSPTQL